MSRWRPPPPHSTAIITRAGYERLQAELDELWKIRRPEVVAALAAAAAEGDRSENAEYTYRKKQLGEIDRRVRYLSKRLPSLKVVDAGAGVRDKVYFGAQVAIEDEEGRAGRYRIVGPDETDARSGAISIDSPLARAMLGKRVGDAFEAELPDGKQEFAVRAIDYPAAG
ncbi:MAG TPA: transcription elongation factor GreB [Xanthomonadaceae bacterium]|jgi:transcription elongation factor GreB